MEVRLVTSSSGIGASARWFEARTNQEGEPRPTSNNRSGGLFGQRTLRLRWLWLDCYPGPAALAWPKGMQRGLVGGGDWVGASSLRALHLTLSLPLDMNILSALAFKSSPYVCCPSFAISICSFPEPFVPFGNDPLVTFHLGMLPERPPP